MFVKKQKYSVTGKANVCIANLTQIISEFQNKSNNNFQYVFATSQKNQSLMRTGTQLPTINFIGKITLLDAEIIDKRSFVDYLGVGWMMVSVGLIMRRGWHPRFPLIPWF